MKKNIISYMTLLALMAFTATSCSDDSEGLSHVVTYPVITILGDEFYINEIGQPYTDEGCTATLNDEDYMSHIVTTGVDEVDVNAPGLYYINYTAILPNPGMQAWKATRTVAVCDPSITTNLAGEWTTTDGTHRESASVTDYTKQGVSIKYLCPGIFSINDFLAGYYTQYVGYAEKYPGEDFEVEGIIQLTADNKIIALSSGGASAFGDSEGLGEDYKGAEIGTYDPETGVIEFEVVWREMTFHVVLKQ